MTISAFFFSLPLFFAVYLIGNTAMAQWHPLFRPAAVTVQKKAYEFEIYSGQFTTTSNIDQNGSETPLEGSDSFTEWDTEAELRYGYGDSLEFRGGFSYRQNESTLQTNGSSVTNTASGSESYWIGVKGSFKPLKRLRYALDVKFRQTAYTNTEYGRNETVPTDVLVLGDDGTEFQAGLHMSFLRTNGHTLSVYGAFNSPPNQLSDEVVYKLDSTFHSNSFGISLGADGIYSLRTDEFSSAPEQKPREATMATALYNSINRQMLKPYVAIYLAFTKFRLGLKASTVTYGVSTDKGTEFGANLLWVSKGVSKAEEKIKAFKEYTIEASVVKASPRGKFIQIDKGLSGDVEKGMKFDIYQTDFFGGNVLVASGIAYEVGSDKAIIRIVQKYKQISIVKGFTARGY